MPPLHLSSKSVIITIIVVAGACIVVTTTILAVVLTLPVPNNNTTTAVDISPPVVRACNESYNYTSQTEWKGPEFEDDVGVTNVTKDPDPVVPTLPVPNKNTTITVPPAVDISPPVIRTCNESYYYTSQTEWQGPEFEDDVGVTNVTKDPDPATGIPYGRYFASYTAFDAAGNNVTCNFTLYVMASNCALPKQLPDRLIVSCFTQISGTICILLCMDPKMYTLVPQAGDSAVPWCTGEGNWPPFSTCPRINSGAPGNPQCTRLDSSRNELITRVNFLQKSSRYICNPSPCNYTENNPFQFCTPATP